MQNFSCLHDSLISYVFCISIVYNDIFTAFIRICMDVHVHDVDGCKHALIRRACVYRGRPRLAGGRRLVHGSHEVESQGRHQEGSASDGACAAAATCTSLTSTHEPAAATQRKLVLMTQSSGVSRRCFMYSISNFRKKATSDIIPV